MKQKKRDEIMLRFFKEVCWPEMVRKGKDYADPSTGDTMKTFVETAKRAGTTPIQAWMLGYQKHLVALENFVQGNGLKSEGIDERIKDLVNYPLLLKALLEYLKEELFQISFCFDDFLRGFVSKK